MCAVDLKQVATDFTKRDSPIGQPDSVNQLPDSAQLLNLKFDVVEKMLVEH